MYKSNTPPSPQTSFAALLTLTGVKVEAQTVAEEAGREDAWESPVKAPNVGQEAPSFPYAVA